MAARASNSIARTTCVHVLFWGEAQGGAVHEPRLASLDQLKSSTNFGLDSGLYSFLVQ